MNWKNEKVIRIALCGTPFRILILHEEQRYEQRNGKKKDVDMCQTKI